MKEFFATLTVILVIFAALMGLNLLYLKFVAPVTVEMERAITINSSSFINSRNDTLMDAKQKILNLRTEMSKFDEESDNYKAYNIQIKGLLDQMCDIVNGMDEKDVSNNIVEFLNENGGC